MKQHRKYPKDKLWGITLKVFQDERLNSTDKFILAYLKFRQGQNYWTWPNQLTIANESGLELKTVKRSIAKLVELGFIQKAWWDQQTGKGKDLSYHIYENGPKKEAQNDEEGRDINDPPILGNQRDIGDPLRGTLVTPIRYKGREGQPLVATSSSENTNSLPTSSVMPSASKVNSFEKPETGINSTHSVLLSGDGQTPLADQPSIYQAKSQDKPGRKECYLQFGKDIGLRGCEHCSDLKVCWEDRNTKELSGGKVNAK